MQSYDLTLAAEEDLCGIWRYTYETWGFDQAEAYLDRIEGSVAQNPCRIHFLKPVWQADCMSRPIPPADKTRNWPAYNEALKRRGSLTIWFDPVMTWEAAPTGKRGRQPDDSDAAIQTCLTMKVLFGMALRQIEP